VAPPWCPIGYACDRPIDAGNETVLDGIAAGLEYNWNGRRCRFCGKARGGAGDSIDAADTPGNLIRDHCRQLIVLARRPAIYDCDVAAFDKPVSPRPWRYPRVIGASRSGPILLRKPITGIDGCCARAENGQAVALASVAMNWRRFIRSPRRRGRVTKMEL
jgi:hypothetical protein